MFIYIRYSIQIYNFPNPPRIYKNNFIPRTTSSKKKHQIHKPLPKKKTIYFHKIINKKNNYIKNVIFLLKFRYIYIKEL